MLTQGSVRTQDRQIKLTQGFIRTQDPKIRFSILIRPSTRITNNMSFFKIKIVFDPWSLYRS